MKRVSARHQVDGRIGLQAALPLTSRSGRRNRFSSFGADPLSGLQSGRGVNAAVRSDPDVFADALVVFDGLVSGFSEPPAIISTASFSVTTSSRPAAAARFAGVRPRAQAPSQDG